MLPRPRRLLNYKCLNQAPKTTTPLAFVRAHLTTQTFHRSLSLQQSCLCSSPTDSRCLAMMRLWQLQQQWKKGLHHKPTVKLLPLPLPLCFSTSFAQPNEDTSRAMHITSSSTSVGDSSTGTCNTARKCSSVVGSASVTAVHTSPLLKVSIKTPWSMR